MFSHGDEYAQSDCSYPGEHYQGIVNAQSALGHCVARVDPKAYQDKHDEF